MKHIIKVATDCCPKAGKNVSGVLINTGTKGHDKYEFTTAKEDWRTRRKRSTCVGKSEHANVYIREDGTLRLCMTIVQADFVSMDVEGEMQGLTEFLMGLRYR